MKLNHPGIYRVVGEKFELLANVIGEVPCMRITSALLINDLVQKGKFTVLTEESIEVQSVLSNPDKYIFLEYEYSSICSLPSQRKSIRGAKCPNITDKEFKVFVERYLEDAAIPGRGVTATKAFIMERTEWSLAQINVLIMKIINHTKRYGSQQFIRLSLYYMGKTL